VDERAKRILAKVSHAAERVEDMAGSLSSRFPTYSDNIHDDWSPKDFPQGYVLGMRRDLDYMRQQCRALVKFVAQVQALTGAEPLEIEGEGEQVIQ
jgi:hypothetical protein